MLHFIQTPVVKKVKTTDDFYHGIILNMESYVAKGIEYLSVSIGMEEHIFKTSVRAIIDTDHPLYKIGLDLLLNEFPEGTELSEDDFLNLAIRFKVADVNDMYSLLTVVEYDEGIDAESCKRYKRH